MIIVIGDIIFYWKGSLFDEGFKADYLNNTEQASQQKKYAYLWFHAVMIRGFISLFEQDHNPKYLAVFANNLQYAWNHMRDEKGLFYTDWTLKDRKETKGLLDQCAFVEMYARLAKLGY